MCLLFLFAQLHALFYNGDILLLYAVAVSYTHLDVYKRQSLHGHNWIITVYCRSARLNSEGMVVDFTRIKEVVTEKLDHQNLNEVQMCIRDSCNP